MLRPLVVMQYNSDFWGQPRNILRKGTFCPSGVTMGSSSFSSSFFSSSFPRVEVLLALSKRLSNSSILANAFINKSLSPSAIGFPPSTDSVVAAGRALALEGGDEDGGLQLLGVDNGCGAGEDSACEAVFGVDDIAKRISCVSLQGSTHRTKTSINEFDQLFDQPYIHCWCQT